MNYVKIQQEIVKAVYNDKTRDDWRFVDGVHDGYVWVVFKGYAMYAIPERLWFLDTDRIIKNCNCALPLSDKLVESHKKVFDGAVFCNFVGTRPVAGNQLNVYSAGEKEVYVNPKFLKVTEMKNFEYRYKMVDHRSPLYLVNTNGDMVACIMHVNCKG